MDFHCLIIRNYVKKEAFPSLKKEKKGGGWGWDRILLLLTYVPKLPFLPMRKD